MTGLIVQALLAARLGPLERYEAWRAGPLALEARLEVVSPEHPQGISVQFAVRGRSQDFTSTYAGKTERFMQSGGRIEHRFVSERTYVEHRGAPGLAGPPPEAGAYVQASYPFFLRQGEMGRFVNADGWKPAGSGDVEGVPCDVIAASNQPPAAGGQIVAGHLEFKAWIDATGRIAQWQTTSVAGGSRSVTTYRVRSLHRTDWSLDALPPTVEGSVPMFLPKVGEGATLGRPVELGNWKQGSAQVEASGLLGRGGLVILLVEPGCAASAQGRRAWEALAKAAHKVGAEFVEVSLGPEQPGPPVSGGRQYWDKSGELEDAVNPPGTPFVLRLDAKGVALRQWYGFSPGEEMAVVEALF
jgi:hypothetical protein